MLEQKRKYKMKKPTVDDFRQAFPNIGYDLSAYVHALEIWAEEAEKTIKKLEHYRDTTVGLYATDRPDLVKDEKGLLFELTDHEKI